MLVELSSEELCAGRHLEHEWRMETAFRVGCRDGDVIGMEERDWWE